MDWGIFTLWSISEFQPKLSQSGRVNCVTCAPLTPRSVLAGTETGGLFLSSDGAATFTHVDSMAAPWVNAVHFLTPSVALATTGALAQMSSFGGLWVSRDAGVSWSQMDDVPGAWPDMLQEGYQIACPFRSPIACVGTNRGLLLSTDFFRSFSIAPIPVPAGLDAAIHAVAVLAASTAAEAILVAAGPSGMYRSSDGGGSWAPVAVPGMGAITSAHGLDGDRNFALAASDTGLVWVSQDAGVTWQPLDAPPTVTGAPGGLLFARVRFTSFDSVEVYASNRLHLFRKSIRRPDGNHPFELSGGWSELAADHSDTRCLAFDNANQPYLLGTDGGLHRTTDSGGSWHYTAGSGAGLSALQIYDVTGQVVLDRNRRDLYFGTQDNNLWASSDMGRHWPNWVAAEGYALQCQRRVPDEGVSKITFQAGTPFERKISGPLFGGVGIWNSPPSTVTVQSSPISFGTRPGSYVQYAQAGSLGSGIYQTLNYGTDWQILSRFDDLPYGLPAVTDNPYRTTVYQPIQVGTFTDRRIAIQRISLVRIVHDKRLAASSRTYPRMQLSGSPGLSVALGVQTSAFSWLPAFAVDPFDDLHLIASDIANQKVVQTFDGGETWTEIAELTASLRGSTFRFRGDGKFEVPIVSIVQTISFDPDDPTFVLLGTNGAGLWSSSDRGETWEPIGGSRGIPKVSAIYWLNWNDVVFSSYGRGLWRMRGQMRVARTARQAVVGTATHSVQINADLTLLGFDISHFFFTGSITGLEIQGGRLQAIYVFPGTSHLVMSDKETVKDGPEIIESAKPVGFIGVKQPPVPPEKGWVPVGIELFAAGGLSVVYAPSPLELTKRLGQPDQAPIKDQASPYSGLPSISLARPNLSVAQAQTSAFFHPDEEVTVLGRHFDRLSNEPVSITLDGRNMNLKPVWDTKGVFTAVVRLPKTFGVHTMEGNQKTKNGPLEGVEYFSIVPDDSADGPGGKG